MGVIRLSFCFANDNRMTPPSGLQLFSKCEPDGGVIRLSFAKQNDNLMILKVILVILIWVLWELIFFMEVQEEGMGVEEEFILKKSL